MPEVAPLFPVSREHLEQLSRDPGILQHAESAQTIPEHASCTDDVARALLVDLLHQRELGWPGVEASAARHVAFLHDAFEPGSGRFRNFRHADGTWLDVPGSDDANARALQALAEMILNGPAGPTRTAAYDLFQHALPTASQVAGLRPRSTVVLACDAASRGGVEGEVAAVYQAAGNELRLAFESRAVTFDWPWPEPILRYESELVANALMVGGRHLGYPRMARTGLRVLDWLIDAQTTEDGTLRVIGTDGWWPQGGQKARFDQQPISATSLLLAADTAYGVTGAPRYLKAVEMAYAWFLGRNDSHAPVADPASGGCRDGIGPHGVIENQGAESTLMWLMAAEHMRARRKDATAMVVIGEPASVA
jgi:hypothetical protein